MPVAALTHPVAVYMFTYNYFYLFRFVPFMTLLVTSKLLPIAPSPVPSEVSAIAACMYICKTFLLMKVIYAKHLKKTWIPGPSTKPMVWNSERKDV